MKIAMYARNYNKNARSAKRGLVVGLGKSGMAAARLLLSEGRSVTVVDECDNDRLRARAPELEDEGAEVLLGCSDIPVGDFGFGVVSPGVAFDSALLESARQRGIELVSELELGWSRLESKVVAITGSNGKSTAVKLLSEVLQRAGMNAVAGGNYGVPVSEIATSEDPPPWLVLEVSSFQLETILEFRADVAVLLNLNPNHLDRHGGMQAYRRAKMRIFENATRDDICIAPFGFLNHEDGANMRCTWRTFGTSTQADSFYSDGCVFYKKPIIQSDAEEGRPGRTGGDRMVRLEGTCFANEILGSSVAAVLCAASACGVDPVHVEDAVRNFEPLPHRMQKVRELDGVVFINDSKATNLAATAAAVKMVDGPIRLIAGGRAKEEAFEASVEVLAANVEAVYLIGEASPKMYSAWKERLYVLECGDLGTAVSRAWADANRGDTILLAPGCASFDQFGSFEERGNCFIKVVKGVECCS